MQIQAAILGALALPKAHCVIVESARVVWLKLREAAETLDDFVRLAGGAIVGPGKKKIATRIGGIEIGSLQKRFDSVVIVAARVESHAETDHQALRSGIAFASLLEDLDRGSDRAMEKEFTSPVKEVALGGIHVGGDFVFICRRHELPVFFFHFAKQIMQFPGVLAFQKILD